VADLNKDGDFMRSLALTALLLLASAAPAFAAPKVGDPAPEFSLSGSDGKTYTLSGLLAETGGVVLAFFPKAFTPG
jgi:peroxiredoxin Q/BCP